MDVGPRDNNEKVEAASRVSWVLNDWVEQWLVVGGVYLAPRLGPDCVRRSALNGGEAVGALNGLPIPDAGSNAGHVVGLGLDIWRSAKPELMLHDQLAARHACR